ncbi:hypothetical protein BP5796_10221 [Coleophoma crateriformis]|uniref:YCII-related domain-containing protein n=1 Tax=Coleophoma crateriformis TaxID=565419 RepID=A0A3D8QUQ4_9HELO|nr:hypothetical protein BP5796_10221 [Coleophoma crateriformis]
MASTSASTEKFEWIVILPDNAGALSKRMEIRPKHIEGLKPAAEAGFWKMGGAYLEDIPKGGEGMKILGSCMVAVASSKDEVIAQLKKDIYAENDVWDFEKIQIFPYKCAFRNP